MKDENVKKDGLCTEYWDNGQKSWEGTYRGGEPEGRWTWWHENGQKSWEEHFKDGELDGLWTYWDEDGNITQTEMYENGRKVRFFNYLNEDKNITELETWMDDEVAVEEIRSITCQSLGFLYEQRKTGLGDEEPPVPTLPTKDLSSLSHKVLSGTTSCKSSSMTFRT